MSRERDVKLTIGFSKDRRTIDATVPDDEPNPWDLDSQLKVVGKRTPKVDAVAKVTGAAKYTHDLNFPGMLFGGFVRSKHAHADVNAVDLDRIQNMPGVERAMRLRLAGQDGKRVRFAGQPIAAICANSPTALEAAIRAVEVEYDVLPHAARVDIAMKEGAAEVNRGRPNFRRGRNRRPPENFDSEMAGADATVEMTCTTQVQTHACLETHGSVAKWDGDQLTVWSSTQATFAVLGQVARALRLERSQINVICEYMGGGFGSKFMAGLWTSIAAQFARDTGKPVKIMLDRQGDQIEGGNRPDSIQTMKLGVSKDGKLGAYEVTKSGTPGVGRGAGSTNPMIYDFGPTKVEQGEVATHAGASQAFRAPGHPQGNWALESIINVAAETIGMDPLDFRLKNDSHPIRRHEYELGAEKIGWKANRKKTGSQTGRYRTGYGVAAARWGQFGGPRAEVRLVIHQDGSVEVRSGAQDIGVGTRTVLAVVAAEELGLADSMDRIKTFIGNTKDPIGPASGGSRTCPAIVPAIRQAAFLAGNDLKALVARRMECKAEDLVFKSGNIAHVRDASKRMSFSEACRLIDGQVEAVGKRRRNDIERYVREVGGVQFAKCTVDTWTGVVKVDHMVALQDAGRIINHLTAEGQVLGGVIQGISYALHEIRVMDRIEGRMLNADMEGYKISGPKDMPTIDVELVESASGANGGSTAGIGEPTSIPTASAIGGAVHNAIGVPVKDLPLTPDRVLAALEEVK